jgi:hypothetical protein
MDLKRLEAQGHIEKANFSAGQIKSNLTRAQRDLRPAKANLKIDEEWAYTIAYHAMLRAGRAFMFASGPMIIAIQQAGDTHFCLLENRT